MTALQLQYRHESIPLIKQAILDSKNMNDYEQQVTIRKAFPFKVHNLVAIKVWNTEVTRLRNEFYKHRKFL